VAESSFRTVVARTWSENVLFSVMVELTYRCNLDCFFCYNDLGLAGAPLSTPQWIRFFEDLKEMRVLNLTLSGGEPLAHPDFMKLGGRARELGFVVRVKSNGHALSGALARRLKEEVDPFLVEVSLHGSRAETHDRQTRVPGSFVRLVRNVGEMKAAGLRVKMNSTLTSWNEDETEAMFALADRLAVSLQFDPEVTPRDDGDRAPLTITASEAGKTRLFRLQFERGAAAAREEKDEGPPPARGDDALLPAAPTKHCGAGSSGIAVDPFGNVYPCVQWRRPVGNLHETSIRDLWTHSPRLAETRALTERVKGVVDGFGVEGPLLGFCPGLASTTSGDPLAVYAGARQRARLLRVIQEERRG
jgi:MoaA/NifB/PqqE/SkfB family radical SAM enzyme